MISDKEQDKRDIIYLWTNKYSVSDIAVRLDLKRAYVFKIINKYNIKKKEQNNEKR